MQSVTKSYGCAGLQQSGDSLAPPTDCALSQLDYFCCDSGATFREHIQNSNLFPPVVLFHLISY